VARRNRLLIAVIVGVMVFATVFAVAATLSVTPSSLGAGTGTVSSCDTNGVATSFDTTYSAAAGGYEVSTVHVAGIATPGCDGLTLRVTLVGAGDASLAEQTTALGTPATSPTDVSFAADNILASLVLKVSVVIA
jgi:hypothetical protein